MVVGVVGDAPMGQALEAIAASKKSQGRTLKVIYPKSAAEMSECHVLFLSRSQADQMGAWISGLEKQGVLPVGDTEAFVKSGGIINFFTEAENVKFEVNPQAAQAAGLKFAAQLLQLARIVDDTRRGGGR